MNKSFYRVNHEVTQQGLWYDWRGEFTGLIHNQMAFCQNRELKMDFDPDLVGYISAVETLEQLFVWFSREDIGCLQGHGFYIHEYQTADFRWYTRFNHFVINQATSTVVRKIPIGASTYHPDQTLLPQIEARRAQADADMRLPAGKVCGNCAHFARCEWLVNCSPDNSACDWAPSRFVEAKG